MGNIMCNFHAYYFKKSYSYKKNIVITIPNKTPINNPYMNNTKYLLFRKLLSL